MSQETPQELGDKPELGLPADVLTTNFSLLLDSATSS